MENIHLNGQEQLFHNGHLNRLGLLFSCSALKTDIEPPQFHMKANFAVEY